MAPATKLSTCLAVLLLSLFAPVEGIRNSLSEADSGSLQRPRVKVWMFSLNQGDIKENQLNAIVKSRILAASRKKVSLVVIALQEVKRTWLPTDVGDWTVYRTKLDLWGSFSLQTLVLARGLRVRTHKLLDAQLPDFAQMSSDGEAPGCGVDQPGSEGCWAMTVAHTNTKGTLVMSMEITPENTIDKSRNVSLWPRLPPWSAHLVIANSHLGHITDPLSQQMLKRATQLWQAMELVSASTSTYTDPIVMLGDWNFRMSPLEDLKKLLKESHYVFPDSLSYTGPVILHGSDKKLQLSYMENAPLKPKAFYDEISLMLQVVPANKKIVSRELQAFRDLKHHMNSKLSYPLTCKYKEGSSNSPVPYAPLPTETILVASNKNLFNFTNGQWAKFAASNHNFKTRNGEVTRVPSFCDRIVWSTGHMGSLMESGVGVEVFSDTVVEQSDHLALWDEFNLKFHEPWEMEQQHQRNAFFKIADNAKMKCCCQIAESFVPPNSCRWQKPIAGIGSGCNFFGATSLWGYHTFYGEVRNYGMRPYGTGADVEQWVPLEKAWDRQRACEELSGQVVTRDGKQKFVKVS